MLERKEKKWREKWVNQEKRMIWWATESNYLYPLCVGCLIINVFDGIFVFCNLFSYVTSVLNVTVTWKKLWEEEKKMSRILPSPPPHPNTCTHAYYPSTPLLLVGNARRNLNSWTSWTPGLHPRSLLTYIQCILDFNMHCHLQLHVINGRSNKRD